MLPDQFCGDGSWEEWLDHFKSIAAVNEWDDDKKLLWLKVRLSGKAKAAFNRLTDAAQGSWEDAIKAL